MNTVEIASSTKNKTLDACVKGLISLLEEWIATSDEILGGFESEEDAEIDISAITHRRDLLMPRISCAVSDYTQLVRTTGLAPDAGLLGTLGELSAQAEARDAACIEYVSRLMRKTSEGLGGLKTARRVGGAYFKRTPRSFARYLDTGT